MNYAQRRLSFHHLSRDVERHVREEGASCLFHGSHTRSSRIFALVGNGDRVERAPVRKLRRVRVCVHVLFKVEIFTLLESHAHERAPLRPRAAIICSPFPRVRELLARPHRPRALFNECAGARTVLECNRVNWKSI